MIAEELSSVINLTYTGDEAVRTTAILELPDAEGVPKDPEAVCDVVQEILYESLQLSNYTILDVRCESEGVLFKPEPKQGRGLAFKTRDSGLRRQLRSVGVLEVEFEVTGRYNTARRVGEDELSIDKEFAKVVEVNPREFPCAGFGWMVLTIYLHISTFLTRRIQSIEME